MNWGLAFMLLGVAAFGALMFWGIWMDEKKNRAYYARRRDLRENHILFVDAESGRVWYQRIEGSAPKETPASSMPANVTQQAWDAHRLYGAPL